MRLGLLHECDESLTDHESIAQPRLDAEENDERHILHMVRAPEVRDSSFRVDIQKDTFIEAEPCKN